jgi:hypothetical protein
VCYTEDCVTFHARAVALCSDEPGDAFLAINDLKDDPSAVICRIQFAAAGHCHIAASRLAYRNTEERVLLPIKVDELAELHSPPSLIVMRLKSRWR